MRRMFLLITVLSTLAVSSHATAQPAPNPPAVSEVTAGAPAPTVGAVATAPVANTTTPTVLVLQQQAPEAPKPALLFSFDVWLLIILALGTIARVVTGMTGQKGEALRKKIGEWTELAYYAAERAKRLNPTSQAFNKLEAALGEWRRGLDYEGIKPTDKDEEMARARWAAMAEAEHVSAAISAKAAQLAVATTITPESVTRTASGAAADPS